jgi:hypothetical protein
MKIQEIDTPMIKWSGTYTKGPKGRSSYKLSATATGYGEIGLAIMAIKNNIWKPFYIFVDKDWPKSNLRSQLMKKISKISRRRHGKMSKETE